MSIIKKWSTGPLGNEFPDHSDRGNPNTRGLTSSNIPGIEGYIEEDEVIAYSDNRPLKNLVENDLILSNNLTDVTSEVDYGVIRGRYNEFNLDILEYETLNSPDEGSTEKIEITPLRIKSGSIFINGSVIRTGNQKIIYFIKVVDGNETEFLFPNYNEFENKTVTVVDDPEFNGEYVPVYGTVAENIPENHDRFEIEIINTYSDGRPNRKSHFNTYRNGEDITPYPPDKRIQDETDLIFGYDANYGQNSKGVWLQPDDTDLVNLKVSDVEVKKDIKVNDKYLDRNDFKLSSRSGMWETVVITDGIFFDNIRWEANVKRDIKSLFVDEEENIYFIYDFSDYIQGQDNVNTTDIALYRITSGTEQVLGMTIDFSGGKIPNKLENVEDYLFVMGDNGLIGFINILTDETISYLNNLNTTERVISVEKWDDRLWVATETELYHTPFNDFKDNLSDTTFEFINVKENLRTNYFNDVSVDNFTMFDHIQGIYSIKGNYVVDSSLINDIDNILSDPSFENVGNNSVPIDWKYSSAEDSSGINGMLKVVFGDAVYGNKRAILTPQTEGDNDFRVFQTINYSLVPGKDWTFSIHLKASEQIDFNLTIYELDEEENILSSTTSSNSITTLDIWNRYSVTHTAQSETSSIKVEVHMSGNAVLQLDAAQLEIGTEPRQFVHGYDYLFITFRKQNDASHPPFIIIDSKEKYLLKYVKNLYGEISGINDILDVGHNEIYCVDDKNIYKLHFMNSISEYDRISITNITDYLFESDFKERIDTINAIEEIDNRIYIGTSILNKNISFTIKDDIGFQEHTVDLIPNDTTLNFLEVIGNKSFTQTTDNSYARLEFENTKPLIENDKNTPEEGKYIPGSSYGFKVVIDGDTKESHTESIIIPPAPFKNEGPWDIEEIYEGIVRYQNENNLFTIDSDGNPLNYSVEWHYETSTKKIDGFYSIGKNKLTKYLRGNVREIAKPENVESKSKEDHRIYLIRDNTILKAKYDPNIKKEGDIYPREPGNITGYVDSVDQLPETETNDSVYYVNGWGYFKYSSANGWVNTNYFYKWDLYSDDYELREFRKKANQQLTFNDTTHDNLYVDLPLDEDFDILNGSLRVKINDETEYGFSEGVDYFVDYDNNRIIRNNGENLLNDPKFQHLTSDNWDEWTNSGNITIESESNAFEEYAKVYLGGTFDKGIISQLYIPDSITLGDTYTFSIYVKSNIISTPRIAISETSSTAPTTVMGIADMSNGMDWVSNPQYFTVTVGQEAPKTINLNEISYDTDTTLSKISIALNNAGVTGFEVIKDGENIGFTTTGSVKVFTLEGATLTQNDALHTLGIEDGTYTGRARETSFGDNFDYENRSTVVEAPIHTEDGELPEWKRYEVTISIQHSNTDAIRVELMIYQDYKLLIKNAQLENNSYATPFIIGGSYTRIDPNDTVYCDFVQYKSLQEDVDYKFNCWDPSLGESGDYNRRVCLINEPHELSEFYLDYKYERIFNPYRFGNSLPRFDVKYDPKDDYFLYENSGRIWAINQILALLSLDENNRLKVSYNYFVPRIDKIKIRNHPDKYGNFIYYVKGVSHRDNPYSPVEDGHSISTHVEGGLIEGYSKQELEIFNTEDNDTLYAINVTSYDFDKNDVYDRRIFVDSETSPYYNISLQNETLAYFPFEKDFISTNGLHPIKEIEKSRITSIVKNYAISQNEEVGAWSSNYDLNLRYKDGYPEKIGPTISTFVDSLNGYDDGDVNDEHSNYDGSSRIFPFKTIKRAVRAIKYEGANPNIVVTSTSTIYEDVEVDIDTVDHILIKADTHFTWRGNFYNKSEVRFQGIRFENFNHYIAAETSFYHCDFFDSSVNNFYPLEISFYNCKVLDVHNTFLNVNTQLFPNTFIHPYYKSESRDDGIAGEDNVATSDWESIYPNESGFNFTLEGDPRGYYTFYRCLINRVTTDLVNYNIGEDKDWKSDFTFEKCTIVNSSNLFSTNKIGLNILYNECIIWNNRFYAQEGEYWFNSASSIEFLNTFIDFSPDIDAVPAREINLNPMGELFGRETCSFSGPGIDPGFIETEDREFEDYHLKSVAKGYLFDSPAVGMAADGRDIGAYDETRERLDLDIPTKFKSNFALIQEPILYPIVINSEKITLTLEFKPLDTFNSPGILFDTRSESTDEDYIVVVYNNNSGDKVADIHQDPDADETDPYTFKVIVANKIRKFAAVSPIKMNSDSEFQIWNRISFTINYEKTFNQKASFDEVDRYQNIITFYHNDELAVESFIKNDLNRDEKNALLQNKFALLDPEELEKYNISETTNAWNLNNISDFISIGGPFSEEENTEDYNYVMSGYYSELRIDNKFTNRKELRAWNNKKLAFNDPNTYVDQSTFVKTIDSYILNEFWSLRDKYGLGAKGNKFGPKSRKRFTHEKGELIWSLTKPTQNLIENSDFSENQLAHITADEQVDLPANISKRMFIKTPGSRVATDHNGHEIETPSGTEELGVEIRFYDNVENASSGIDFNTAQDLLEHINKELFRSEEGTGRVNGNTKIRARFTEDMKLEFYTLDWSATSIKVYWENPGDPYEMGFSRDKLSDWPYLGESSETNVNVFFVDSMRTDSYTPDGSPSKPFKLFSVARTYLEEGSIIKIVNGQTTTESTYSDFGIDLTGGQLEFTGKSIDAVKSSSLDVYGVTSDSLNRHEVWTEFDPTFTRLSGNSLRLSKNLMEDVSLKVYFNRITNEQEEVAEVQTGVPYTLSIYIYSKEEVSNKNVRFIKREFGEELNTPYNFDNIERIFGNWLKLTKYIDKFDDIDATVGIALINDCEIYIDALQLEQSVFSTPYIKNRDDSDGVLEIDKSLLNEDTGIIFFRFRPILNFDTNEEVVLLNTQKYVEDDGELVYSEGASYPQINWDKGFRISYRYDDILERGILEYKTGSLIQNDASTHRFYIPRIMWDKWHSVAIYYNYPTNRFIYFFDHFKQDIESVATLEPFGTNLFIGRDVPRTQLDDGSLVWKNSGENMNKPSANILVKDIILTNYTISEKEIENWISAEEFYKESSFNHLLDEYQEEILNRIRSIEMVSQDTEQVLNKIDEFDSNISTFEENLNSINTELPKIQTTLEGHSSRLASLESDINTNTLNINDLYTVTTGHDSRLDVVEDLAESNSNRITNERTERISGDLSIRNDLASNENDKGAYLVGLYDSDNRFSSTTIGGALRELAGVGRDADHTVKGNYDIIQNNISLYDQLEEDVRFMKDGNDGDWTKILADNNGWNIKSLRNDVNSNDSDISTLQTDLTQEVSNRENADIAIRDDLASTDNLKGASLIGVEDANNLFTHTVVESVLSEITGLGRTNQTIKSNYDAIVSNDTDISNLQGDISTINTELLEIDKVKDGNDGSTWTTSMNLKDHEDGISLNASNISNNATAISQNTSAIGDNTTLISGVQMSLNQEISDRETADTDIVNNLASNASNRGASLIGIYDASGVFASATVESALQELDGKIQSLQNSLRWQDPVATPADLPTDMNEDGDARTVLDDGDGFAAQYVWNGTAWVKIADINWGSASDISFDNSTTQLDSTSVQSAIEEVYERAKDPTKAEDGVEDTEWSTAVDGRFFHDIQHDLGTYDVTVLPTSKVDGRVVGVDEIETIDDMTTRVWVTINDEGLDFTVFGGMNNYAKVVGSWTASGGSYYHTVDHKLNTTKLMYSIFDVTTGKQINLDEIVFNDNNTMTLWSSLNTIDINIFLLKKTSNTKIKDIDNWAPVGDGMYVSSIKMPEDYDAIYNFIDASGRATNVDDIWFEDGYLKIKSTSDEKLRLVILK